LTELSIEMTRKKSRNMEHNQVLRRAPYKNGRNNAVPTIDKYVTREGLNF